MERQICFGEWLRIETHDGDFIIDADLEKHGLKVGERIDEESDRFDDLCEAITIYIDTWAPIQSIELVKGYGARLSMPGYLDRTEWSLHKSAAEAEEYLSEMYGDDEDEDEDEDEE